MNHEDTNSPRIPVLQELSVALGILLLVFGTTYIADITAFFDNPKESNTQTAQSVLPIDATESGSLVVEPDPFENILIAADSAYIWDVRAQKALYNKNADEQLPLASITKLMTALVAYELISDNETIDITLDALSQDGDSGLLDGESFTLRDITDLTLITSSNDGAYALAAAAGKTLGQAGDPVDAFVNAMNIRAEEVGLSQTYFNNPTGLDITETKGGGYGSARDVAFLMEYIVTNYPNILELTQKDVTFVSNTDGATHNARNTNASVVNVPGLIGSKTGYTDLAGGNLVIAYDAGLNRPIIVSVMGSTIQGRFNDVALLSEKAREYTLLQK